MPNDHRRGIIWALGGALGVASFVIPWKMASLHGTSATNALILLVVAAMLNSLLTGYQQRTLPRFRALDLGVAAGLAVFTLLGNLASALSIQLISPALLTVVQRSEVIIVAMLAWPILGERIDRMFWVGAAIAGGGLLLMQTPFTAGEPRTAGIAWAMGSAFCFGSMAVLTRTFIHRIDVVSVNALRLWLAVAMWFAWNGFPDELYNISVEQACFAGLAAFFGPFMGRLCMMMSARHVEARITSTAPLAAPPLTLLLGYLILSDLPSSREIAGGVIMLVGISIPILGWTRGPRKKSN